MKKRRHFSGEERPKYLSEHMIMDNLMAEFQKSPRAMDMELVMESLDYLYPFDVVSDRREVRLALAGFHSKYDLQAIVHKRKLQPLRVVVLIAILLLAITAVGFTLGVNIWKVAYEWTSEHLFMQMALEPGVEISDRMQPVGNIRYAADVWGDDVYALLEEYQIYPVLPAWMPEKFSFSYVEFFEDDGVVFITAGYVHPEEEQLYLYLQHDENLIAEEVLTRLVELDEAKRELYDSGKQTYYLMNNIENVSMAWIDNDNLIIVSGSLKEVDLKRMADSINKR